MKRQRVYVMVREDGGMTFIAHHTKKNAKAVVATHPGWTFRTFEEVLPKIKAPTKEPKQRKRKRNT